MIDEEFQSIKFFEFKYRRGDQIIQPLSRIGPVLYIFKIKIQMGEQMIEPFCKIGCSLKIRSHLFNLRKFRKSEKSAAESCRMHWNLMNDEEYQFIKVFKFKETSGDQIIQLFWKILFPQEITSPSLIWGNLENLRKVRPLRKVLLNHIECIEV